MRAPAVALTLLLAGSASAHEGAQERAQEAAPAAAPRAYEPPAPGTYELPPIQRVATHELLDDRRRPSPLPALATGEVALVSFVYLSCPAACPTANAVLQDVDRRAAADDALRGRLRLVTVSFDPVRDTPARMHRLHESLAPRGDWRFLTAPDEAALAPVLVDYGQRVRDDSGDGRLEHVLKVFLVDDARRVRNIYSADFLDAQLLLNDVRTVLLGEAGDDS